jgi:hypothetical protein
MCLVIAERGQQITKPLGKSKTYFTPSASPADAIHADIRPHVDGQPSAAI